LYPAKNRKGRLRSRGNDEGKKEIGRTPGAVITNLNREVNYIFKLANNRIASLEIRSLQRIILFLFRLTNSRARGSW
jgi:hypothetical protein